MGRDGARDQGISPPRREDSAGNSLHLDDRLPPFEKGDVARMSRVNINRFSPNTAHLGGLTSALRNWMRVLGPLPCRCRRRPVAASSPPVLWARVSGPPPCRRRRRPVAVSSPPVVWAPLSGPPPSCRRRRPVAASSPPPRCPPRCNRIVTIQSIEIQTIALQSIAIVSLQSNRLQSNRLPPNRLRSIAKHRFSFLKKV